MIRFLIYLSLLGYGHKKAKHSAFHGKFEKWEFIDLKLSECGDYWQTKHKATCTKCDHTRMTGRSILTKSFWPGMGRNEADAREYALTMDNNT